MRFGGEGWPKPRLNQRINFDTAALESMGYSVVSFTYDQVSDLEKYDSLIVQRAETLGLKLANRTASFLDRRNTLHGKLFPASR
ncbi:Uncharacterised protein [Collinsella intestinalis]|nr:Uncharacterised protein [Collinsella intestinalis]